MSRFYVEKESVKGNQILISGKEAHHILDVMRLKLSDEVVVFDGTGKEYVGKVRETGTRSLLLEIIRTREAIDQQLYRITLIQAITKKDKMDYIVEKATELGVNNIVPIMTERTIPDWNDTKKEAILGRWNKIALEAAKQCGRTDIPKVHPVKDFDKAIDVVGDDPEYKLKLIAALNDKAVRLKDVLKGVKSGNIAIAIGPEGDFTNQEVSRSQTKGFKTVSLGPRVLKSDTAGLAVIAMINYECYG